MVVGRIALGAMAGASLAVTALVRCGSSSRSPLAIGIALVFAWASARTTVYTITNRRVVMRFGIALPMTLNLPFTLIALGRGEAACGRHRRFAWRC